MRSSTRHFLTGLTSLIALTGFVYLLFRFGELESVIRPQYRITVLTNRAAGLRPGSNVELNGVHIGVIDDVTLSSDPEYPVRVLARVQQKFDIPIHATPEIVESIIGGNSTLLLNAAPTVGEHLPAALSKNGDAELRGIHMTLVERVTSELDRQFEPLIAALNDFREVGSTFRQVGENINSIIGTPGGDDPDQQTIATLVTNLNGRLGQIETALDNANVWLGDAQLRSDAKQAVTRASELIDSATDAVSQYATLATKLEGQSAAIAQAILPVADQMATTLEEVQMLMRIASSGDGSVSQALNNPDLYLSLTDAAQRLDITLKEVQLLIQKLRAEGFKIGL